MHSQILAPVVTLVAWTIIMCVWMMAIRLPALKKAGIDMSKARGGRPGILDGMIDERAQWPAHNYNHLMEQPTLFYAIALALALLGSGNGMNAWIAWAYIGLRIAHSIVQATFNKISVRFPLFVLSTVALAALTLHAGLALLHGA
ncbi:MAPEG family protein [Sphingomonas sp. JC676]|uniref:MAPEG family protein n=1 Tax=Sphingomonas sp. JC676 TaxID=2768065 RepID=UPI0016586588|nr:MAPEG family protein [Sphingomonas sp. JC676]MBC9031204.1 MAPEG family protein [Sphingomonas sp. JC676]